jgi:hypothetical protein
MGGIEGSSIPARAETRRAERSPHGKALGSQDLAYMRNTLSDERRKLHDATNLEYHWRPYACAIVIDSAHLLLNLNCSASDRLVFI